MLILCCGLVSNKGIPAQDVSNFRRNRDYGSSISIEKLGTIVTSMLESQIIERVRSYLEDIYVAVRSSQRVRLIKFLI